MLIHPHGTVGVYCDLALRIEKLVYGGDGLARSEGQVVLIPYVLPAELIAADVRRQKNDLLRGELRQVLEPSPFRIDPPCTYFGRCGGCHYQHTSYENQLEQKRQILIEVLHRVGRISCPEVAVKAGEPWQYRNRTQLHISKGEAGYFAAGSHTIVPINHCPISSPRLNQAIEMLAHQLPRYRWFDATVELFTNETDLQINVLDRIPNSVWPLFEGLGTREPIEYGLFRVSRNAFFQVNRFLVERLVETATEGLSGGTALDLYAGVGLFSKWLARGFERVIAVESGGKAFHDLKFNMDRAGLRVETVRETTENFLSGLEGRADLVLADPPRSGLGKVVVGNLLRIQPLRIVVVSCDPATLARDLRSLLDGGYGVEKITLIDLFPQTFHMESVVHLRQGAARDGADGRLGL
jgi:23S rRNA (uracil1939-C5)-methyltransferase